MGTRSTYTLERPSPIAREWYGIGDNRMLESRMKDLCEEHSANDDF
jgi:hypothetical protein